MTENDFFADNTVADKPKVSADEFKEEWAGFHYVDEQEPEFRHQRDEIDELLYPEIPVADLETDFLPEAREKLRAQIRAVKDNSATANMLTEKDKTVADEVADAAGKEPYFHDLYAWAVDDKKFLDIISAKEKYVVNDSFDKIDEGGQVGIDDGETSLMKAKKTGEYIESDKFNKLLASIFYEEGEYEDNPKKIDQPTNIGIIQNTLNNFNKAHPNIKINKKLKDISKDDARLIYKLDFYDYYRLEEIDNPIIAKTIFHMLVNSSPENIALIVQRSIKALGEKIDIDGIIGSKTINSINNINDKGRSRELNRKLIELRLKYEDSLNDHNKYPGRRIRFENLLD